MSFEIVLTIGALLAVLVGLALEVSSADVLLLAALAAVTVGGVIDLDVALQGFANATLLALGALYVIAAALRETGALDRASTFLLGAAGNPRTVLLRLSTSTAVASAFLNNTPIVAMGIPSVRSWARRHDLSASKLLMPLSFASILGGLCTLIGTSTNLVSDGLLRSHGLRGLGFFELALVGVPCALVGVAYLVLVAPRLLRGREGVRTIEERERQALVGVEVEPGSPLVGRTVRAADLERFPGLSLVQIDRGEIAIAPVAPGERVHGQDRLLYASEDDGPARPPELAGRPGLRPVEDPAGATAEPRERELHSVVVKEGSKLAATRVRDAEFHEHFNAGVTGVHRGGQRLEGPVGDVVLRPGDVVMLDTARGFRGAFEDAPEFFITSEQGGERPVTPMPEREEAGTARRLGGAAVLAGVVALAAAGVLHVALAALLGALLMIATGFIGPGEARQAIDWEVLVVVGAALGMARALEASGTAELIAAGLGTFFSGHGPVVLMAGLVFATMLLTGLITNNATVALMFPVGLSVAQAQGIDPRPLIVGITLASSLALWTPLGYQTNLMVYGPGNYRFSDFVRVGLPLQLLLAVVVILVTPLAFGV